jgi:hypothetical protein
MDQDLFASFFDKLVVTLLRESALLIENTRIRLASIDAFETDQTCLDAHRKLWTCGIEARVSAQAELLAPVSAAAAPSPNCNIKGNVNRRGERIYFRPGQLDYDRVDMSKQGTGWFCTEQDAQAAGWPSAAR